MYYLKVVLFFTFKHINYTTSLYVESCFANRTTCNNIYSTKALKTSVTEVSPWTCLHVIISKHLPTLSLLFCYPFYLFILWMKFFLIWYAFIPILTVRINSTPSSYPVGWGWRIYWLLLCRGVPPPSECPGYYTKQSEGEAPVILELWGMPLLPSQLWPRVVALDRVLSMGQIKLNCILMLNWIVRNRTVLTFNCKQKLY